MSKYFKVIDHFAAVLTRWVIAHRWGVILLSIALALAFGSGVRDIEFSTNYRAFFSEANPELKAFKELQNIYTKNDNLFFVLDPDEESAFSPQTLNAVEELTEKAWQIPYAIRVDSISNFQHTYAIEDNLIVEDLITDAIKRDFSWLSKRQEVALAEPLLRNQLITDDADVTAVNVVLQYPEKGLLEVPEAVTFARNLVVEIETAYPGVKVYLTGVSMLNNAFAETSINDGTKLMPMMFIIIFVLIWLIIRSFTATFAMLVIISFSTMIGMGVAQFASVKMTPIAMLAPIVILTLAITDSIHILLSLRRIMLEGHGKTEALVEAMRVNFLPVSITSLTTIVGFLVLNFSDSPPYWHLGNIIAAGIAAAWLYSITLLPALLSLFPYRTKQVESQEWLQQIIDRLAEFVIVNYRKLFFCIGTVALLLLVSIPKMKINDQWVEYFAERIEFRADSDKAQEHFGLYPIEFSVPAAKPGGVSEPEYLENLERFANWMRMQPNVTHVYSLSDIMKRLNRNMHADNDAYYRIPNNRELSAQYLLLYELSLPYGLDLNDRINIDRSASRVTATLSFSTTADSKAFFEKAMQWQEENWPSYMHTAPTSAAVMFTYISERNIENMVTGTILAITAIMIIMIFALQSMCLGVLSILPNGLPILMTFGVWALLVGEVGFSIATVASISLGIVVDDTVHLLSAYIRAHNEHRLTVEDSIRYAFHNVGVAIVVNTIIMTMGFLVTTTSAFKINVDLGFMTVLSILGGVILDFLFMPALLLLGNWCLRNWLYS